MKKMASLLPLVVSKITSSCDLRNFDSKHIMPMLKEVIQIIIVQVFLLKGILIESHKFFFTIFLPIW